jgi:glyoxylate/hydroxypyruvate reductase A
VAQPILLVKSGGEAAMPEWREAFAALAPGLDVRSWDDATVDPDAVRYVLVWDPEPGRLATYRNLQVIFGSGAGVDFIAADPTLPRHLPLVRMATRGAAQRMGEFVTWAVLSLLKDARRIGANQAARRWDHFDPQRTAPETVVGIMGLGHMGEAAARMLQGVGFQLAGWSRTPKSVPGLRGFVGPAERDAFLAACDILVCLLPATRRPAASSRRRCSRRCATARGWSMSAAAASRRSRTSWPRSTAGVCRAPCSTCSRPSRCRPTTRPGRILSCW